MPHMHLTRPPHPHFSQELAAILSALSKASDDDLVFWDHLSCDASDSRARDGLFRMFTFFRVSVVVLPDTLHKGRSLFELMEPMAYLARVRGEFIHVAPLGDDLRAGSMV